MRMWTGIISYALLLLFCWQLAVLFVSPFWSDRGNIQADSRAIVEVKSQTSFLEYSGDVIDWGSDSSLFEEVLEEELEVTGSVSVSLKLPEFKTYAEALILPCRNFSQTHLDPPEITV